MTLEQLTKFYSNTNRDSLERLASGVPNNEHDPKYKEYQEKIKKINETGKTVSEYEEIESRKNDRF